MITIPLETDDIPDKDMCKIELYNFRLSELITAAPLPFKIKVLDSAWATANVVAISPKSKPMIIFLMILIFRNNPYYIINIIIKDDNFR